jgi:hypothetical protein
MLHKLYIDLAKESPRMTQIRNANKEKVKIYAVLYLSMRLLSITKRILI